MAKNQTQRPALRALFEERCAPPAKLPKRWPLARQNPWPHLRALINGTRWKGGP